MKVLLIFLALSLGAFGFLRMNHSSGKEIENALEGTFARDGNKGKVFLVLFYTDKEEKIKQKN